MCLRGLSEDGRGFVAAGPTNTSSGQQGPPRIWSPPRSREHCAHCSAPSDSGSFQCSTNDTKGWNAPSPDGMITLRRSLCLASRRLHFVLKSRRKRHKVPEAIRQDHLGADRTAHAPSISAAFDRNPLALGLGALALRQGDRQEAVLEGSLHLVFGDLGMKRYATFETAIGPFGELALLVLAF